MCSIESCSNGRDAFASVSLAQSPIFTPADALCFWQVSLTLFATEARVAWGWNSTETISRRDLVRSFGIHCNLSKAFKAQLDSKFVVSYTYMHQTQGTKICHCTSQQKIRETDTQLPQSYIFCKKRELLKIFRIFGTKFWALFVQTEFGIDRLSKFGYLDRRLVQSAGVSLGF